MPYRLSAQFPIDAAGAPPRPPPEAELDVAARHYRARDFAAAAVACDAILQRQPRQFDALHLRGVLWLEANNPVEALAMLRCAECERPGESQLLFHIGNALLALQRHKEAEAAFRQVLAVRPDHVDAMNNLGNALANEQLHAEAAEWFRRGLAARPTALQPLYNLGRSLVALQRPDEAIACFRAALACSGPEIEPARLIDLHVNLSEALVQLCRYQEALAVLRDAPAAIAHAPAMQWNSSLTLLMLGDYREGWQKYEQRFLVADHDPPRDGAVVPDLAAVAGRRVLVFAEQGRGDMLQFARYLPLLAARGAQVLVETYADLKPLFAMVDGVAQVVTPEEPPPDHDLLTPLLSLPSAFGTTLDSIPAQVPYLHEPRSYGEKWAALLGPRRHPRIGIAWWGSQHIAKRSMNVATLAPLLELPGLEFHALQKEITAEDQAWIESHGAVAHRHGGLRAAGGDFPVSTAMGVTDHSARLADFADTAALIAQMDMVVTIDTSVAHLAGALGKPVWIMLVFSPDWRWLTGRDDNPWYPTARLFRQAQAGDWDAVVRRVADALPDALALNRAIQVPDRT